MTAPNRPGQAQRRDDEAQRAPMATQDPDDGFATRATYRSLLVRGFTPGEAANLTAYLAGIEVGQGRPWRLADVDRLLFLRELCRTGRLGADDGLGIEPISAGAGTS